MAYDSIKTTLKEAGHTISPDFDKKMSDPKFAEQVRGALAEEGHNVPDSASFFQKYSQGSMPNARDTLERMRKDSIAKQDVTQAPMKKGKSGPSIPEAAYGKAREVLAHVPALAPALLEAVTGEGAFTAMKNPETGKLVAVPVSGKQSASDRFKTAYQQNAEAYGRGEGFGGMLSDPLNLIPAFGVEGKIAGLVGKGLKGTALAKKLAQVGAKAEGLYAQSPWLESISDVARAGGKGALLGAAYGGAQTALDPEKPEGSAPDAALFAGALGGVTGATGRALQRWGMNRFPGLTIGARNMKVSDADKKLILEDIEKKVFKPGVLPTTRGGLLRESRNRATDIGMKYDQALSALEKEAPEATISISDVSDLAKQNLRDNYLNAARSGMVPDPTTEAGYKLPDEALGQIDERIAKLQASHLGRIARALGSSEEPVPFPTYVDMITGHGRANRSEELMDRLGIQSYAPASRIEDAISDIASPELQRSVRKSFQDNPAAQSIIGGGFVAPALGEELGRSGQKDARLRYLKLASRLAADPYSDFSAALGARYMSGAGPKESLETAQRLNRIIGENFDPREFNTSRSSMLDPRTWLNPTTGTPSAEAQELGDALHRASVEELKYAGAPGGVDAAGKRAMGPFGRELGTADRDYKFEMALNRLINSPGSIGLSDRINLGVSNAAVSPWLWSTGLYKAGSGVRNFGAIPSVAAGTYDFLRNPTDAIAQGVGGLLDWRRHGYMQPSAFPEENDTTSLDSAR